MIIKFTICFFIGMEKPNVKSYNIASFSGLRYTYITKLKKIKKQTIGNNRKQ